jgi:ABC-type multidrug transport system fused ATPase/permease subunit
MNDKGDDMRKLLVFLKAYRKESILAPLFKLLEASFELLVPLIMAGIIDRGIDQGDRGYIWHMGIWLLVLGAVGLLCSITAQFFAARAAVGFAKALRQHLFDHLLGLTYTDIDQFGSSAMITRMTSDINQVQTGVNMVLRLFLRSPVVVFGAAIMAFTIDVKSALIFVVAIPVLLVVVFGLLWYTIPLYRKVQGALDRVLGLTRENLTGVRVIRAFHKEEEEKEQFTRRNEDYMRLQLVVGRISAFLNPVTFVIINLAMAVLIYIGAIQVNVGNLKQGEVVAILNYMSQILVELIKLANLIITITKALACADRVADALEYGGSTAGAFPEVTQQQGQSLDGKEPYLVFDHVSFTYKGAGEESLTDIHFEVMKGETIGIIGGTGSGKTTLVNLIPRFYEVTKGAISLMGQDIRSLDVNQLRHKIGIVPQKAALFRGTIRSNIAMGNEKAGEDQMWEALEAAQAREVVQEKAVTESNAKGKAVTESNANGKAVAEGNAKGKAAAESNVDGLEAEVAGGGRNFSGGQKQRLTIARALVRNPHILILDDSSSALDYATDAKLRAALAKVHSAATFIIAQRSSSLRHADKIIVLDNGHMAGIGTHEELLKTCNVYQEICSFEGVSSQAAAGRAL